MTSDMTPFEGRDTCFATSQISRATNHTRATDGEIGHVEGMLVDDSTWAILYLVVNCSSRRRGFRM